MQRPKLGGADKIPKYGSGQDWRDCHPKRRLLRYLLEFRFIGERGKERGGVFEKNRIEEGTDT